MRRRLVVPFSTAFCFCSSQELLHLGESPLQFSRFECTELQIEKRRQTGRDPGMKFAGVDVADQLLHGVLHCDHVVQFGQWIDEFRGKTPLPSAPNSAQFGSFVGIGVKETLGRPRLREPGKVRRVCFGLTKWICRRAAPLC